MKKIFKNWYMFRELEPTSKEFQQDFEKKLDADREGWTPKKEKCPEIGGEKAWPLLGNEHEIYN